MTALRPMNDFARGYADARCDELVLFPTNGDMEQAERLSELLG